MSFFVPTMLLLLGDANMYQRLFSARNAGSAKAVFYWIFGVVILESVISMLGLVGSVAVTMVLFPNLVEQAQLELIEPNQKSLLEARQSGSESIIPAIARYSGLPLILGLVLASAMMAIIVSTADSFSPNPCYEPNLRRLPKILQYELK